ncbi:hypothetical protein [Acinetobacter bereziniae]|uniref:hypothetical protein n=1 Tax=Acinetobacter bereziniae TaxID=106648 RepID=UPI0012506C23|nr:hypothetical protein [Acinetobacter bereziniae]
MEEDILKLKETFKNSFEIQKKEINEIVEAHGINRLNENSLVYFKEINHLFNEICDYIIFKDSFDAFFHTVIQKTIDDNYSAYNFEYDEEIDMLLMAVFKNLVILNSIINKEKDVNFLFEMNKDFKNELNKLVKKKEELEKNLFEVQVIKDDLKNKKVNEIFEDDSKKFKLIARFYEMAFYLIVTVLIIYFLGLTFYVNNFNFLFVDAGFPEKIHGNLSPEFYIQKISLLILSTTLAAFLLKRSFMNRRLADDAYRTAKELDALPRYMEGMSDEMKEKIRFDLAYKYFGNGIHHDSYTSGENLMHENIKANTDFIKAVKDLSPKNDEKNKKFTTIESK